MSHLAQIAETLESLADAVGMPREKLRDALAEESLIEVKNLINPHPPSFKSLQELHDHLIVSVGEFSQLFGQLERQLGAVGSLMGNAVARAEKSKDPALFERIRGTVDNYFRGSSANLKITASGLDNFANVLLPHYWKSADALLKSEAHRWSQTQRLPGGGQPERSKGSETQPAGAAPNRVTQPSGQALGQARTVGDRETRPSLRSLRGVS